MHFAQFILPLILVILPQIELPRQPLEASTYKLTPELDDRGTLEQLTLESTQDSFRRKQVLVTGGQHTDRGHQVSRLQENNEFTANETSEHEGHGDQVSQFQEDTSFQTHEKGPLICSNCLIKQRRHLRVEISPRGTGSSVTVTDFTVVTCHSCVNLEGNEFLNHSAVLKPFTRSVFHPFITPVRFFQKMNSSEELIKKASGAAEGFDDKDGTNLSMRSLATLSNMITQSNETLTMKLDRRITEVEKEVTTQMQKDKRELMMEIEKRNKLTQESTKTDMNTAWKKMEESRQKDKLEFEKRLSEINNQIRTGGLAAEENLKIQTEAMQQKVTDALTTHTLSTSSTGSWSSVVSSGLGRPAIPQADPRRKAFHIQADQARRTTLLLVWDIESYTGTPGSEEELKYYLHLFRNKILHGMFGIDGRRNEYIMESIDEGRDAFRWRLPETDRETGRTRVNSDGKKSPLKIYVRFEKLNQKAYFETHKQYLNRDSPISVAFYAPKYFRRRYDNLMTFAKAWKANQSDRNARFQLAYLDREDEMIIETKTGKYGGYTRLADPHPTLFAESIVMFDNLEGDAVIPDQLTKEEHKEETWRFRALKDSLNPIIRSPSAKRRIEDQPIDSYTEKLRKKSKGNSISILGTNDANHDLKRIFDLDQLEDSSHQGRLRARQYVTNRTRLMKVLKEQNVSPRSVVSLNQRDEDGRPTGVSVKVPTAVLLVSVSTFLSWQDNKIIDCVNRKNSIMIVEQRLTSDRDGLETEIMLRVKHIQTSSEGVVHIYLTKSKILSQGHTEISGTRMGIWTWENVIEPILIRTELTKAMEVNAASKSLNDHKIPKTADGRLKKDGSTKGKKSTAKKKMRQLLISTESSNNINLQYNLNASSPGLRKTVGGANRYLEENPDDDDVFPKTPVQDAPPTGAQLRGEPVPVMPPLVPEETEHRTRIPSPDYDLTVTPENRNTKQNLLSLTGVMLREIERARKVTHDSDDDFSDTENANYARKVTQERIASGEIYDRSLQITENDESQSTDHTVEPEPEKMTKENGRGEVIEAKVDVEPEPDKNKADEGVESPEAPIVDLTTPLVDLKAKKKTRSPGLQPPTKRLRMTSATVDNADFSQEAPENTFASKYVSDDYTGTGKIWMVEVPEDFCQRFKGLFDTFTVGSSEIQVHLCGTRRYENGVTIITIMEMLIPQQTGTLHHCIITDPNFVKNLDPRYHVGQFHVHPDGSGRYLSGIDCHTCGYFEKLAGDAFVSGVYDPVQNKYSFMRIKETKRDAVLKCRELSKKKGLPHHNHPDAWATVPSKEIVMKITMVDLRGGTKPKDNMPKGANLIGPFDPLPKAGNIRDMSGNKWTPISRKGLLALHGLDESAGLDTLRKAFEPKIDDRRPKLMQPGEVHDDVKLMEECVPVEDHYKLKKGLESQTGVLLQRRAETETLKRNPIQRTQSVPDLDKLQDEVERLNLSVASLTKANMGLNRELTRMKEKSTIFGGLFESIHDESMIARMIRALEVKVGQKDEQTDWLGGILGSIETNKEKLTQVVSWVVEMMTNKLTGNQEMDRETNIRTDLNTESQLGTHIGPSHLDTSLAIVSWNMNGHSRYSELLLVIEELLPNLICLQETKLNSTSCLHFQKFFPDYLFLTVTNDMESVVNDLDLTTAYAEGGVSIMWRRGMNSKVLPLKVSNKSFVAVILDTGVKTLFLSVYAPTRGKDKQFSQFLEDLSALFVQHEKKFSQIVMLGDFNVNEKSTPERTYEFEIWMQSHGLVRQDTEAPTHRHYNTRNWTHLDISVVSDPSLSTLKNTDLSFTTSSDHLPILLKLKTNEDRRISKGNGTLVSEQYQGNLWKLDDAKKDDLNQLLSKRLNWLNDDLPQEALEARLVGLNDVLVSTFNEIMPRPQIEDKPRELWGLEKERRILKKLHRDRNMTPELRSKLWDEVHEIRVKRRDREARRITNHMNKSPGNIFKFVSRLKGRSQSTPDKLFINGKPYYGEDAHEEIIKHYDRMGDFRHPEYNEESNMDQESILSIGRCVNIAMNMSRVKDDRLPHVSIEELKRAIFSFPNGKASDLSGCSHDFFKHLDDSNLQLVINWMNALFDSNQFTSPELSKSRFSLLFKSGDTTQLGNYRRLTVSSVMLRLIERILSHRGLADTMDSGCDESQWGFRPGRSFEMALLEMNQIIMKHRALKKPLVILSTDVMKCFPRQDGRVNMLQMILTDMKGAELTFTRDTYLARSSHLKVENKVYQNPSIADNMGETEGGLFSPSRAKLNFDTLAKTVNNSDFGIEQKALAIEHEDAEDQNNTEGIVQLRIRDIKTPLTQMADDCAYYENDLIRTGMMVEGVLDEAKITRVHFNQKKCWVLCFNMDQDKAELEWAGIQQKRGIKIGMTRKLKYLGMEITDGDYPLENVRIKIGKAQGVMRILAGAGMNTTRLGSPKQRLQMITSYVNSTCLSGLNAMVLSAAAESELRKFGDSVTRKTFHLHEGASVHLAYLMSGKVRLNVLWRCSVLSLWLRVLALDNHLTEVLRYDYYFGIRESWMTQVVTILMHYDIKNFDRLIMTRVVTKDNCKQIHRIMKEFIYQKEFHDMQCKVLMQKGPNRLDYSSLRPGKMSRHLENPRTIEECRGVTMVMKMLSHGYFTPYKTDKLSMCPACGNHPDSDMGAWRCKKAYQVIKLKQDLLNSLPFSHPARDLDPDSDRFTIFCLDPESENLGCYRIFPRPSNYVEILSLTRRIANYVHVNRIKALIPARLLQRKGFHTKRTRDEKDD